MTPIELQNLHLWRDASLLSLALLICAALSAVNVPRDTDIGRLVMAHAWLISHLVLLTGGCLVHARWRETREPAMGWLATAFLAPAFALVPLAMVRLPESAPSWTNGVSAPLDLACTLVALPMVLLAARKRRFPDRLNPIAVAAMLTVPYATLALVVAPHAAPPRPWVVNASGVVVTVIAAAAISRLDWLHVSHRVFLVLGVAGIAVAHDFNIVTEESRPDPDTVELTVAAISIVSSVVVVVLTLGLFRRALDVKRRRLAEYQARAEAAEELLRREEELMHEVRATIAGISTATCVLHGGLRPILPVTEQQLTMMLTEEVSRVQRLLCGSNGIKPERIALDDLLLPQVIAQRALGHDVRWEPSGLSARTRHDKLAEAVHVVLTNATRYSAGGPVHVWTIVWRDVVCIGVTDSGPGVPPEMAPAVFQRGIHDQRSPGMGVGLYLARKAVEEDGGSIRLQDPQPGCGATFVITVPVADEGDL